MYIAIGVTLVVILVLVAYMKMREKMACIQCNGINIEQERWTILNPFLPPASVDASGKTWLPTTATVHTTIPQVAESLPAANATNMRVVSVPDHLPTTM